MGRLHYGVEELLRQPLLPGMRDPTLLYFHFRPARPANLLVTRDPASGELNLASGIFGQITDRPYTICLHSAKQASPHSTRNLSEIGAECVVALPGRDLIRETWIPALSLPRGIFEAEVAELTLLPSHVVSVPGIAECPVNLECRVVSVKDQHSHIAVFLEVLGASLDESVLAMDRLSVIRQYPTYEVDDATNAFGGAIERLGVNGELFEAPGFPAVAKRGAGAETIEWLADLQAEGYLNAAEHALLRRWCGEAEARETFTTALAHAAWEEWEALHAALKAHLGEEG
jgi:flavin reductase (DIM6/NTAB) family NADH-FMN oxidoreductase RutF